MAAYYNEIDPYAAQWLRNLIEAGLIAPGVVDERSIEDVRPDELAEFTQCHFFAGIGGWSYALRLAGWPDDQPVWTGSCPCQPFSSAGKGAGFADQRHLWPAWFHLIRECRPAVVLGEQVANSAAWLDLVRDDLEGIGFACAAASIPATCVGAKHVRCRFWYVANPNCAGLEGIHQARRGKPLQSVEVAVPRNNWEANPGVLRAADGLSGRLGKPHNYRAAVSGMGNAIVPQVAAEFIRSYLEARQELRAAA